MQGNLHDHPTELHSNFEEVRGSRDPSTMRYVFVITLFKRTSFVVEISELLLLHASSNKQAIYEFVQSMMHVSLDEHYKLFATGKHIRSQR